MDRLPNAVVSFGLNFSLGYVLGVIVGNNRTGIRAGLVLGGIAAVGSWLRSESYDEPAVDGREPIEIEID
jgi:hypothetical protein